VNPLGDWIIHSNKIHRQYNTYRDENHLYLRSTHSIKKVHFQNKTEEHIQRLPNNVIPCKQTMMGIIPREFTGIPKNSHKRLQPEDHQSDILPEEILIATDASVHKGKSAIAWIVTTINGKVIKKSQQSLIQTHFSSFQAEAFGVFLAFRSMHQSILQQHTKWTLFCDNKALIHRLQAMVQAPVNIEWTDSDILIAIKQVTPENGRFQHVKGHTKITSSSSIPEKLNHIVDRNANKAIEDTPHPIHFNGVIRIFGDTTQLFSVRDIVHYCRTKVSQHYWLKRLGTTTFNLIDWELYQQICISQKHYNSIKKMLVGITPTQQRLNKLNIQESPLCPLCNETNESIHHVLICNKNQERIQNYKNDIAKTMEKYFKTQDSVINIIDWIIDTNNTDDNQHLHHQNAVGWVQLIQGKFTTTIHDHIQPQIKIPSNTTKVLTQLGTAITTRWRKAWLN
jgi:Reverse transcriptase-like